MQLFFQIDDLIAEIEARATYARLLADRESGQRALANGRGIAFAYAELAALLRNARIGPDDVASKPLAECR